MFRWVSAYLFLSMVFLFKFLGKTWKRVLKNQTNINGYTNILLIWRNIHRSHTFKIHEQSSNNQRLDHWKTKPRLCSQNERVSETKISRKHWNTFSFFCCCWKCHKQNITDWYVCKTRQLDFVFLFPRFLFFSLDFTPVIILKNLNDLKKRR